MKSGAKVLHQTDTTSQPLKKISKKMHFIGFSEFFCGNSQIYAAKWSLYEGQAESKSGLPRFAHALKI